MALVEREKNERTPADECCAEGGRVDGCVAVVGEVLVAADGVEVPESGAHDEAVVFGEGVPVVDVEHAGMVA